MLEVDYICGLYRCFIFFCVFTSLFHMSHYILLLVCISNTNQCVDSSAEVTTVSPKSLSGDKLNITLCKGHMFNWNEGGLQSNIRAPTCRRLWVCAVINRNDWISVAACRGHQLLLFSFSCVELWSVQSGGHGANVLKVSKVSKRSHSAVKCLSDDFPPLWTQHGHIISF